VILWYIPFYEPHTPDLRQEDKEVHDWQGSRTGGVPMKDVLLTTMSKQIMKGVRMHTVLSNIRM
jgi:hypothetical protein